MSRVNKSKRPCVDGAAHDRASHRLRPTIALLIAGLLAIAPLTPAAMAQSPPAPASAAPPAPGQQALTPEPAADPSETQSSAEPKPAAPSGETAFAGKLLPENLSFSRMYGEADPVVKAVMIGLAFASLVSWTVFVAKTLELGKARRDVRRALRVLVKSATLAQALDQLRDSDGPAAEFMHAAAQEIRLSASALGGGLKERIALQLERLEIRASRKISRGTGVLATIGSTGVFVGLFGTVWGIMNSFIGISNAHTTNLAVVAPGIAQALMATAMGLIAAIPAVVTYNVLTRRTADYRLLLGDASAQVMRLVSRDLDRTRLPLPQAAE
jgi:biopolymer transport protein ExbB